MEYTFINAERHKYAVYYAVYAKSDLLADFDWNEMLANVDERNCFFVIKDEIIIGGFTLTGNELCHVFIAPPFSDKALLWKHIIKYVVDNVTEDKIVFQSIFENDKLMLIDLFNVKVINTQRRMFRPTDKISVTAPDNTYFVVPNDNDKQEIIQVVYEAHSAGYTSAIRIPDKKEIENAINKRFALFAQTSTLYMSTLVKSKMNNEIAGVCIAGIYPDSANNFSTIHQVSVRPEYRRRGIAETMMLNSINQAHSISPVINLGVTVGNPAEYLYDKIGFFKGLEYSELHYTV